MNKYRKVIKPKETLVKDDEEIRVTAAGSVSAYVSRAATVFNELDKKFVIVQATGNALTKAVTTAEVIKRRFKGIHQITKLSTTEIVDEYEPLEEGLDKVTDTRSVSVIEIKLSKEPLDVMDKGYQPPLDESMVKEYDPEERKPGKGTGRGRGKGAGRGRGKGRGKSSSPAKGKGSSKGKGKGTSKGKSKGKGKGSDDSGSKGKGKGKGKDSKGKGKSKSKDYYDDYSGGKSKGKSKSKSKSKDWYEEDYYGSKGKGKSKGKSKSKSKDWYEDDYYGKSSSKGKGSKGKSSYDYYDAGYSKGSSKGKGKSSKGWY